MTGSKSQTAKPVVSPARPTSAGAAKFVTVAGKGPSVELLPRLPVPADLALVQYVGPASIAIHPALGGVIRGGVYTCRLRLAVELVAGVGFEPWSKEDRSKIEEYAQKRNDK